MQLHLLIYVGWRVGRLLRPAGPGTTLTLAHTNNQYIAESRLASKNAYAEVLKQLRIASPRCPLTHCRRQLKVEAIGPLRWQKLSIGLLIAVPAGRCGLVLASYDVMTLQISAKRISPLSDAKVAEWLKQRLCIL